MDFKIDIKPTLLNEIQNYFEPPTTKVREIPVS